MQQKNEIDFFELAGFLWAAKFKIFAGALLMAAAGAVYAFLSASVYESDALISARDAQGGNSGSAGILSQLSSFGGAMGSQFGLSNTNLDRMEILLRGRDLADRVLNDHPDLVPRLYPKLWDPKSGKWKTKSGAPPIRRKTIELLRGSNLAINVDPRKKVLKLAIASHDSTLSADLVGYYLTALGNKIREDTRKDADGNRAYLEQQLGMTQDPLLRERIQGLMSVEIEKAMLVSSKAFDVLEKPVVPMSRMRPKRRQIVTGAFVIGLVFSSIALMGARAYANRKAAA